jgi:Holliday junction resolvase-like predicted endonuclease
MREAIIQSGIIKDYETDGWYVIKLIQTNKNGMMDLILLKKSITAFAEIKQPGKEPTDLQKYRAEQLRKQGFEVFTFTSRQDAAQAREYLNQKIFA